MKHRRKKICPECKTKLKTIRRNGKSFVQCPKCLYEERYKERVRQRPDKDGDGW